MATEDTSSPQAQAMQRYGVTYAPDLDIRTPMPRPVNDNPFADLEAKVKAVDAWRKSLPIDFKRLRGGGMVMWKGKF